jgi:hypothetical protein
VAGHARRRDPGGGGDHNESEATLEIEGNHKIRIRTPGSPTSCAGRRSTCNGISFHLLNPELHCLKCGRLTYPFSAVRRQNFRVRECGTALGAHRSSSVRTVIQKRS